MTSMATVAMAFDQFSVEVGRSDPNRLAGDAKRSVGYLVEVVGVGHDLDESGRSRRSR